MITWKLKDDARRRTTTLFIRLVQVFEGNHKHTKLVSDGSPLGRQFGWLRGYNIDPETGPRGCGSMAIGWFRYLIYLKKIIRDTVNSLYVDAEGTVEEGRNPIIERNNQSMLLKGLTKCIEVGRFIEQSEIKLLDSLERSFIYLSRILVT